MSSQAPSLPLIAAADESRAPLVRRAKLLSWLSLVWMTAEGTVGVIAGLIAGSVALTGFGLDSAIEGAASAIVIWRFTGGRESSDAAERRAQKLVGVSFFCSLPTSPRRRRSPWSTPSARARAGWESDWRWGASR